MNVSSALYTSAGYVPAAAETSNAQKTSAQPSASYNYDSVSISKEGLAELKSLLQAAKNSKISAQNDTNVKTIEQRAHTIVMSKVISLYASSKG